VDSLDDLFLLLFDFPGEVVDHPVHHAYGSSEVFSHFYNLWTEVFDVSFHIKDGYFIVIRIGLAYGKRSCSRNILWALLCGKWFEQVLFPVRAFIFDLSKLKRQLTMALHHFKLVSLDVFW
jgi:hypothetical protein